MTPADGVRFEGTHAIYLCEAPDCGAVLSSRRVPSRGERFCRSCRVAVERAAEMLRSKEN